jgi:hypothetical protein
MVDAHDSKSCLERGESSSLSSGTMEKEVFEKEIAMCQKLSQKNGGKCNWGECKKCGVVPLLYKLGKNKFFEDKDEIEKIKNLALQ